MKNCCENCMKNRMEKLTPVFVATPYVVFVEQTDQLITLQKRRPVDK